MTVVILTPTPGISNISLDGANTKRWVHPLLHYPPDFNTNPVSVTLAIWALKSEIQLPSFQFPSPVFNKLALFVVYNPIIGLPATKMFYTTSTRIGWN